MNKLQVHCKVKPIGKSFFKKKKYVFNIDEKINEILEIYRFNASMLENGKIKITILPFYDEEKIVDQFELAKGEEYLFLPKVTDMNLEFAFSFLG